MSAEQRPQNNAVPVTATAMKLLDIHLKQSGAIIESAIGEFTASGQQELALLRGGGTLELFRIDNGQIKLVSRLETRSVLRCLAIIRLIDAKRDVLAVGADGGAISIIDFEDGKAKIVHCIKFGKSGCRRGTPGQYLASDPKGRALMISAVENQKLVYVLNGDASDKPIISDPLEAHRKGTLVFATVGLDNGNNNPIFATLEIQYPDTEDTVHESTDKIEKQLAYYELDSELKNVSRRWTTSVHRSATCLAAIPGDADGPGGVLVGGEDWIEYLHESITQKASDTRDTVKVSHRIISAFPRRKYHPENKGILITKIIVHRQKESKFFALAQNELGDVYKVDVKVDPEDRKKVTGITVTLFDVLPLANSLNVTKDAMLFVAAEFGDHNLYQFERIDLPEAPSCTSDQSKEAYMASSAKSENEFYNTANASEMACKFNPSLLKNLRKVYTMDNAAPMTGVMVAQLAGDEVSPQIYTLNGRGPRSSLRIMRHGAAVTELAVSELPGIPGGIFTIAENSGESGTGEIANDRYIVISFQDATLVLSVGESIEEVGKESGFEVSSPTLACNALGSSGGIVQVHPQGVRQIQEGKPKQWNISGLKKIEYASANETQVIIALAGGQIRYFELNPDSGNLTEPKSFELEADVCCLDVGTLPPGKDKSLFAAIGCRDQTVRIVSLDSKFSQRDSIDLASRPHSVALQIMTAGENNKESSRNDTILSIGLDDGSSLRTEVDAVTGTIRPSPTRRFLGAKPVSISCIHLESNSSTLLLSSRPWISRLDSASGKNVMTPLSYVPLDHGCSFNWGDTVQDGIAAIAGNTLRILSIDTTSMGGGEDEAFNINKVNLRYTPRQMTLLTSNLGSATDRKVTLVVVECDHNEYGYEEKKSMGFDFTGEDEKVKKAEGDGTAMDVDGDEERDTKMEDDHEDEEKEVRETPIRGPYPKDKCSWGSCIRLLDPTNNCKSLECVELNRNEAALCCASVRFHSRGGEPLLAVGTVTGMTTFPLDQAESHVILYRVLNGERLQLVHKTKVDDGPVLSLSPFQGRLLVGVGKTLRLYEMGKRQLLRKCELRGFPTMIKCLETVGDRAFCGDMLQSIQIVRYNTTANRLVLVANDPNPRPITAQELLDWNTIAVGDKYGNIRILRLPRGADAAAPVDVAGEGAFGDPPREGHTPKLEVLCQYHVGEVVTNLTRASLVKGGDESLIYVTVTGRIGALVPFTSRDDVQFYTNLENNLRNQVARPTGRDPQAYRSYYSPVKNVIDGGLCNAFNTLPFTEQSKIANKLGHTVEEITKKLEDTRHALF